MTINKDYIFLHKLFIADNIVSSFLTENSSNFDVCYSLYFVYTLDRRKTNNMEAGTQMMKMTNRAIDNRANGMCPPVKQSMLPLMNQRCMLI